jgi:hypothetical protein
MSIEITSCQRYHYHNAFMKGRDEEISIAKTAHPGKALYSCWQLGMQLETAHSSISSLFLLQANVGKGVEHKFKQPMTR